MSPDIKISRGSSLVVWELTELVAIKQASKGNTIFLCIFIISSYNYIASMFGNDQGLTTLATLSLVRGGRERRELLLCKRHDCSQCAEGQVRGEASRSAASELIVMRRWALYTTFEFKIFACNLKQTLFHFDLEIDYLYKALYLALSKIYLNRIAYGH
ncbi:hypothetical protein CH365_12990 [Leptospira neocaledonica]|uniref:Uncharacterized protein n=1 Tax=Leptospira neocaledonica TaxID=2023192 RepID=A0A2M9ZW71_9LEPT|nr:hypothetical protein CH365_12990 [Leptospira neocaledonica]